MGKGTLILLRRSRIPHQRSVVPLVVVLTKVDLMDTQLELDLPANETLEHYKSMFMNDKLIRPLREVAGSDLTYVTVSGTLDERQRSLIHGF